MTHIKDLVTRALKPRDMPLHARPVLYGRSHRLDPLHTFPRLRGGGKVRGEGSGEGAEGFGVSGVPSEI